VCVRVRACSWGLCVLLQEVIVDPYLRRVRSENSRYYSGQKQSSGQQGVVWRHWESLRRLLTSERGAWAHRSDSILSISMIPSQMAPYSLYSDLLLTKAHRANVSLFHSKVYISRLWLPSPCPKLKE
jgi:hypothetical protein